MSGNADASCQISHVERTVVVDKLTEIVVVPESLEDGLGRAHVVGSDRFSQILRGLLAMVPRHQRKEVVDDVEVRDWMRY